MNEFQGPSGDVDWSKVTGGGNPTGEAPGPLSFDDIADSWLGEVRSWRDEIVDVPYRDDVAEVMIALRDRITSWLGEAPWSDAVGRPLAGTWTRRDGREVEE